MKRLLIFSFIVTLPFILAFYFTSENSKPFEKLSDYGLFKGNLNEQIPMDDVIPYELNTPLFTDYAHKLRFVRIPKGQKAQYNSKEVFEFPIGTILIKTFYYPYNFRKPDEGRRILETRLLIHEKDGWKAYPYIWNDEQTEAYLDVAGDTKKVTWINENKKKVTINYSIPNMNQCKGCHERDGNLTPIGPSARQLNGSLDYLTGTRNQLEYWNEKGILNGLENLDKAPKLPVWDDPNSGSLEDRARAYLDINCGHCHRPEGPGNTSGLYLYIHEKNLTQLGVLKAPVAAGKGAGDMKYAIEPGNPDKSIMIYRMESLDPGMMMPEMGRQLKHSEGVALIRQWISELKQQ